MTAFEALDTPGTDEDAYLAAGQRVVEMSDLILAVWNGKPAKGKGGTADVVAYASRRGVPLIHIDQVARSVDDYMTSGRNDHERVRLPQEGGRSSRRVFEDGSVVVGGTREQCSERSERR